MSTDKNSINANTSSSFLFIVICLYTLLEYVRACACIRMREKVMQPFSPCSRCSSFLRDVGMCAFLHKGRSKFLCIRYHFSTLRHCREFVSAQCFSP